MRGLDIYTPLWLPPSRGSLVTRSSVALSEFPPLPLRQPALLPESSCAPPSCSTLTAMDPRGGGPSGSNSLVPFASALGAMAPPGSRTVLTRTTTQTYVGGASAPPAAAPFSKLRDLAAKMSSDQALVAQQAKEAAAQLTRAEETRQKLAAEVAGLSKQVCRAYLAVYSAARRRALPRSRPVGTSPVGTHFKRLLTLRPSLRRLCRSPPLPTRTTTWWPATTSLRPRRRPCSRRCTRCRAWPRPTSTKSPPVRPLSACSAAPAMIFGSQGVPARGWRATRALPSALTGRLLFSRCVCTQARPPWPRWRSSATPRRRSWPL